MALGAQCRAFRGFTKKLIGPQTIIWPTGGLITKSTRQVVCQRLSSTKPTGTPKQPETCLGKNKDFSTIYRMPHAKYYAIINKLKWHQTIFFSVAIPISSVLSYAGLLPTGCGWTMGGLGILVCSTLYALGFFATNIVGFVYLSPDDSTVQIAYVDFWGRRKDDEFPADDLVPESELPSNRLSFVYLNLQRYSKKDSGLYKLMRYGEVSDWDRFNNLFGKVEM